MKKENIGRKTKQLWKNHPDLRFEIDNGLTLCLSCHQQVHKYVECPKCKNLVRYIQGKPENMLCKFCFINRKPRLSPILNQLKIVNKDNYDRLKEVVKWKD